jgi:glyoxylase I family protein
MGEILAIHHVSLIVSDTGRALSFYQGVLGLAVDPERPDLGYPGAWLWVGERQIHLLEVPNPDPVEGRPAHGGRDRHLALAVSDLDAVARRLDGAGVAYQRSRSGRDALFCRDPDANVVELIALPARGNAVTATQQPQNDHPAGARG